MKSFALEPSGERSAYINQYASIHGIPAYIVEKDFWACWLLARIFSTPSLGPACVFKGGTSLSKVFGAIERFSEDIDLALSSDSLGWSEDELDNALSSSKRRRLVKKLDQAGSEAVRGRFYEEMDSPRRVAGGLVVDFRDLVGSLESRDPSVPTLEVETTEGAWLPASGRISGDGRQLLISIPEGVPGVHRVRYGWRNFCTLSLFTEDGLPVSPWNLPIATRKP